MKVPHYNNILLTMANGLLALKALEKGKT